MSGQMTVVSCTRGPTGIRCWNRRSAPKPGRRAVVMRWAVSEPAHAVGKPRGRGENGLASSSDTVRPGSGGAKPPPWAADRAGRANRRV